MDQEMKTIDLCKNMRGDLSPDLKKEIKKYIVTPSVEQWDKVAHIIVDPSGVTTLWNAVIAVDPSFPTRGRVTDHEGRLLKDWERIPEPILVLRAIKNLRIRN